MCSVSILMNKFEPYMLNYTNDDVLIYSSHKITVPKTGWGQEI